MKVCPEWIWLCKNEIIICFEFSDEYKCQWIERDIIWKKMMKFIDWHDIYFTITIHCEIVIEFWYEFQFFGESDISPRYSVAVKPSDLISIIYIQLLKTYWRNLDVELKLKWKKKNVRQFKTLQNNVFIF